MTLTAEQKIERAHFWLMNNPKWVAYSGLLMTGRVEVSDKYPTACTDGYNVWYGREFVDSLPEQEVRGLIIHENNHKMWQHNRMWKAYSNRNHMLMNCATDVVNNLEILDANDPEVILPEAGIMSRHGATFCGYSAADFANKDSGEVYRMLEKKTITIDLDSLGGGLDEHIPGDELGEGEADKRATEIDQAIRQGAILAGNMNGNVPRSFDEMMQVQVDFRPLMSQFVKKHCKGEGFSTYRPPKRRFVHTGLYMPTRRTKNIPRAAICIDTSGSIQGEDLNKLISHAIICFKQVAINEVDLIYWDTKVAQHETYLRKEVDKMRTSTKPAGGGGTDPSCVPEYLREHNIKPTCAVILTDGYIYGDWGTWDCPTMWCITSDIIAPFGVNVKI